MQMTLEIDISDAGKVIAQLVKEGLTFEAKQGERYTDRIFITLTGGY